MRKLLYGVAGVVVLLAVSSTAYFSGLLASAKLDANLGFALINSVATAVLAFVAFVNMNESKKVRAELVRPRLALEPTYFEYDTKTGEIIGFNCLNIVNGGAVARDLEIDVLNGEKKSFLYASSIGTNDRVQIFSGKSSELGGVIDVTVKYRNMYNKRLEEILSLNLRAINEAKRKLVPTTARD